MSRHFKIMSRHKTKLKSEKIYQEKEILCRGTIKSSNNETLSQQSFYVATYHSSIQAAMTKVCHDTRHSCRDNYKTNSEELCRDTFKVCRDIIQ